MSLFGEQAALSTARLLEHEQAGDQLHRAMICMSGFSTKLTLACAGRNEDPEGARAQLIEAFRCWPVICRIMNDLQATFPSEASIGDQAAQPLLRMIEARDGPAQPWTEPRG